MVHSCLVLAFIERFEAFVDCTYVVRLLDNLKKITQILRSYLLPNLKKKIS